jgi:hypothetical protein
VETLTEEAKIQIKTIEDMAFNRGKAEGVKAEAERLAAIHTPALGAAKAEGVKAERERIQAVEAAGAGMPAHEKLLQELKYDGATTGAQAAEKILAAEKTVRETRLANIRAEAPKPVPHAATPPPAGKETEYNPVEIGVKARHYRTEMEQKGIRISAREATDHVLAEGGFKVGTEAALPPARV